MVKDRWDGHAYELDIPAMTCIHRVIHVSLLKPFRIRSAAVPAVPHDPVLGRVDTTVVDEQDEVQY